LRIAAADADRTRFLTREVLSILEARARPPRDDPTNRLAIDLAIRPGRARRMTPAGMWPRSSRDRAGYQAASTLELASTEERIGMDVDLLGPLL